MSNLVPDTNAGSWNQLIIKGATWPATTIAMYRDGVAVIPTAASLYFYSPDGILLLTIVASVSGGGVMTIAGLTATETAALDWDYANSVFSVTETAVITDLLAGNATVRNYGD